MKILIHKNVFGWRMTGLIGNDNKWFLGFSYSPSFNYYAVTNETLYRMVASRVKELRRMNKAIKRKNKLIKRLRNVQHKERKFQ